MPSRSLLYTAGGTLRAPWRLLAMAGATTAFAIPALFARTLLPPAADQGVAGDAWDSIALLAAVAAGTWYALRRVDVLPWDHAWLGRRALAPAPLVGAWLLGMLLIGVPTLLLLASGWMRLAPAPDGSWLGAAWMALVFLAPAALLEELVARGYAMSVLRDALGWLPAILLTSVAFGLLHSWNDGATPFSIALVTLAGVFLGVVVMVTESLWAATLAHLAWNWTMAALLHVPVSGIGLASPDYRMVDAGPDWMTGGPWGPEGGAAAAAGMIAGTAYLYARRSRRRTESR